jgi:hypothetical protein
MAAPIGCDSEPESEGTGGVIPNSADSKGAPPDAGADGTANTEADIQGIQGPGGEADPDKQ